jgi:hypothetical protein
VIAKLPNWMDAQFLRSASGAGILGSILLVLLVLFVIRSIGMKLVSIVVIGAAVFGLVHYRSTLETCSKHGCACKLFGQPVPGDHCTNGHAVPG